jgi:hypothetical protein
MVKVVLCRALYVVVICSRHHISNPDRYGLLYDAHFYAISTVISVTIVMMYFLLLRDLL